MKRHVMTPARKRALRKAQRASARKAKRNRTSKKSRYAKRAAIAAGGLYGAAYAGAMGQKTANKARAGLYYAGAVITGTGF
jgi:hypothetical protein